MKRRTSRRLLSILMALCMMLTLLPVTAAADTIANGACGDNLTWVLDEDGALTISGTGDMYDYEANNLAPLITTVRK